MCPSAPPFCAAAVLFWLNYKAAYDNWNEQRMALNKDIHMATKEVVDKLPGIQQTSVQAFSTLFLQLTVNDLGICLPITNASQVNRWAPFRRFKGSIVERCFFFFYTSIVLTHSLADFRLNIFLILKYCSVLSPKMNI